VTSFILDSGQTWVTLENNCFKEDWEVGEKTSFPCKDIFGFQYLIDDNDYLSETTFTEWFPQNF